MVITQVVEVVVFMAQPLKAQAVLVVAVMAEFIRVLHQQQEQL